MAKKITKNTDHKSVTRFKRRRKIRKTIIGSAECPRMSVLRSNKKVTAQLVDDLTGTTLVAASTPKGKTANTELAKELGKTLATQASSKGISKIVFDRSGYIYHGRVAALAEGAREGGLKF